MAILTMTVTVLPPSDADQKAAAAEYERHIMKYGENPAPHLREEAQRDRGRILDCLKQCCDVVTPKD